MPNIARVLKEEIARIGRKEASAAVTPLRKRVIKLERSSADLKKRSALLEKENKQLQGQLNRMLPSQPAAPDPTEAAKARFASKGIKALRSKLRLSQAQFAALIGVSDQAVYNWEKKQGALKLRPSTKAAILAVRGIGAQEARKRLEAMRPKKAASKRGKAKR